MSASFRAISTMRTRPASTTGLIAAPGGGTARPATRLLERAASRQVALEVLWAGVVRDGDHSLGELTKLFCLRSLVLHAATIARAWRRVVGASAQKRV